MRRAAIAAFATAMFAMTVAAAPFASAQVPPVPTVDCSSLAMLSDPACLVVETVDGVLVPVQQTTAEVLAPAGTVTPVAPGGTGAVTPAPQAAPSSNTQATSASSPVAADLGSAPASSWGALSSSGTSSPRVPDVPAGSTLELGPLALPSFGLAGTPAVTADQLAASADEVVLPAARAAAQLPDDSKATAVVLALSMLLLAAGLLVDQVRKARLPIQL